MPGHCSWTRESAGSAGSQDGPQQSAFANAGVGNVAELLSESEASENEDREEEEDIVLDDAKSTAKAKGKSDGAAPKSSLAKSKSSCAASSSAKSDATKA